MCARELGRDKCMPGWGEGPRCWKGTPFPIGGDIEGAVFLMCWNCECCMW